MECHYDEKESGTLVPKLIREIAMLTMHIRTQHKLTYGVFHSYLVFVDIYEAYVQLLGQNKKGVYKNCLLLDNWTTVPDPSLFTYLKTF